MNKTIGKCTFVLSKPLFLEGVRCTQRDTLAGTMRWLLPVLAGLWLMITVYSVSGGSGIGLALWELGVMAFLLVYITVWFPNSRAKRAWNALEAKGQADTERSILFFEDHLEVDFSEHHTEMDYAEIVKALKSKNLLILIGSDRTGIMIKKEDLTGCTCEQLLEKIMRNGGLKP